MKDNKVKRFWRRLGPGLITGAADDDPSGIVTYAFVAAKFGLATLWMAIVTLPFMIIVQRMAGRIGLVSGRGLAGNMKKFYPRWLLILVVFVILIANIINIGADISGMSAAFNLIVPGFSPILFSTLISAVVISALIFFSYRQIASYLKWFAIVMFAYILAVFFVEVDWLEVFSSIVWPKIVFNKDYLLVIAAFFGTTISPYLFFWQASEAVEEERMHKNPEEYQAGTIPGIELHGKQRSNAVIKNEISSMYKDVGYGMFFSNLITFFIIILTSNTLFKNGVFNVSTVEQVASTLHPLAGPFTNFLFLIGIMASGILAIPVLAGSAAYALAELFGWEYGFNKHFKKAAHFYLIIILATILGILIPFFGIHPVQILVYTAIIYGVLTPFVLLLLIHMANNPKIMGRYTSRHHSNIIAYSLFMIMTASLVAIIFL